MYLRLVKRSKEENNWREHRGCGRQRWSQKAFCPTWFSRCLLSFPPLSLHSAVITVTMSPPSRPCWQLHIYRDLAPALGAGRPTAHLPTILLKAHPPGEGRRGQALCQVWTEVGTGHNLAEEPSGTHRSGRGSSEYPIFQPGTAAPSTFKSIQWDEVRREWGQADWRRAGPPCEAEAGAGQCWVSRLCPPGLRGYSYWRRMIRETTSRGIEETPCSKEGFGTCQLLPRLPPPARRPGRRLAALLGEWGEQGATGGRLGGGLWGTVSGGP